MDLRSSGTICGLPLSTLLQHLRVKNNSNESRTCGKQGPRVDLQNMKHNRKPLGKDSCKYVRIRISRAQAELKQCRLALLYGPFWICHACS
jgi:hypothetical protein